MKWVDYKDFKKYVNLIINEDDSVNMTEERIIEIINKIFDVETQKIDEIKENRNFNNINNSFISDLKEDSDKINISIEELCNNINVIYENNEEYKENISINLDIEENTKNNEEKIYKLKLFKSI